MTNFVLNGMTALNIIGMFEMQRCFYCAVIFLSFSASFLIS